MNEINFNCETINNGESNKTYTLKQLNKRAFYLKIDNNINYNGMPMAGPYKCDKPNFNYKIYKRRKKDGKIKLILSSDAKMEQIYDIIFGEISIMKGCSKNNFEGDKEMKCSYTPDLYKNEKVYDCNIVNYCKEKIRVLGVIFLGSTYKNNYYGDDFEFDDDFEDEIDFYKMYFKKYLIFLILLIF